MKKCIVVLSTFIIFLLLILPVYASIVPTSPDSYEPDNSMSTAEVIHSSQSVVTFGVGQHSIYPGSDCDWYKFHITNPPCTVTITTFGDSSHQQVDTIIWIYNSNHVYVGGDDDYGGTLYSRKTITFNSPGWYYVEVTSFDYEQTGYYGITFNFDPPQGSASANPTTTPIGSAPSNGWSWHLPSFPSLPNPFSGTENWVSNIGSNIGNWVNGVILQPIGNGIRDVVNATFYGMVHYIIQPIYGIFGTVFSGISGVVTGISEGIRNVINTIFGLGVIITGSLLGYGSYRKSKTHFSALMVSSLMMGLPLSAAIPVIGYIIAGFMIAAVGAGLVAGGGMAPPVVGMIIRSVGWSVIVLGAIVGLYGVNPQIAVYLFTICAIIILLIAMWTIISYMRRVA